MLNQLGWLPLLFLAASSGCGDIDASQELLELSAREALLLQPTRIVRHTFSWIPPTEYEDGSPLWDLAGFRIYANEELVLDLIDPTVGWAEIHGEPGDIVWMTAYDTSGAESQSSNKVTLR